jgi:hypothetical protein
MPVSSAGYFDYKQFSRTRRWLRSLRVQIPMSKCKSLACDHVQYILHPAPSGIRLSLRSPSAFAPRSQFPSPWTSLDHMAVPPLHFLVRKKSAKWLFRRIAPPTRVRTVDGTSCRDLGRRLKMRRISFGRTNWWLFARFEICPYERDTKPWLCFSFLPLVVPQARTGKCRGLRRNWAAKKISALSHCARP